MTEERSYPTVLKVSKDSKVNAVAGSIAAMVREKQHVEVSAIGAAAVNQAVKALAAARGFVATDGYDLYFVPAFSTVTIEDAERTAMKFIAKY